MPPHNASAHEMQRMERLLIFGASYCSAFGPPQYAANHGDGPQHVELSGFGRHHRADPQARIVALRLAASFASFPCAYPGKQFPPARPLRRRSPATRRSRLCLPNFGKVPDAEQETAADLTVRYDTDVARSAAAWKNAETLRLSLVQKGMTLNGPTASAVIRLRPLYDDAAAALKAHNWEEALSNLQAAEATTQKVEATVGH